MKESFFLVLPDDQTKLKMTINHLEEQIEILKVKIDDINERLNNITLVLPDTHLENVIFPIKISKKNKTSHFRIQ